MSSEPPTPTLQRAAGPRWVSALVLVLYLISLALPAVVGVWDSPKPEPAWGVVCLVLGWVAFPVGTLIWLANPLLWAGLMAYGRGDTRRAVRLGLSALVCALVTLGIPDWQLQIGYFVWLCSIVLLAGASALAQLRATRQAEGPPLVGGGGNAGPT